MVEYLKVYCKPRIGEASALAVYSGGDVYNVFRSGGQAVGMTGQEIKRLFTHVDGREIEVDLIKIREEGRLHLKDRYPYDLKGYYWLQQGMWVVHGVPMDTAEFKRLFQIIAEGDLRGIPDIRIDSDTFTLILSYFDGINLNMIHINKIPETWVIPKDKRMISLVDGCYVRGIIENYRSIVGEDHITGVLMYKGQEFKI